MIINYKPTRNCLDSWSIGHMEQFNLVARIEEVDEI